ncbi:DMT family transporter [Azohydromonas australica]|uniref:DMT family transporter n=1 Tax=Azohydromonas australica TaxID=364039 RepID=UPI00146EEF18|nr:DMT family transporter [Azohydromonas australica]
MAPLPASLACLALVFATTAWGSLFLVGKHVIGVIDPVWFTVVRYALATALLLMLVQCFGRSPWAKLRADLARLTMLGLAGYGAFSILVFVGLRLSAPSHGSVLMATMPFTTLGLRWLLDGIRPPPRAVVSAALALAGVATVAQLLAGSASVTATSQLGDLITLAGTLGWVFYTRGAASLPDHSPLEYTALTAAAALPWLATGAALATACGLIPLPSPAVLAEFAPQLLYVAVVPTVAAALAFNLGVRRLGAPIGTLFLNVVPLSVIAVRALLGAPPQASEIMGAGLVAMALALHAWPARRASGPGLVRARCPGVQAR